MANSPTLITASLDDKELRTSIANLVAHMKRALQTMTTDTDAAVEKMQKSLQKLGSIKMESSGTTDSESSKRKAQLKEEEEQIKANSQATKENTQAHKERKLTLDQEAASMQKAVKYPAEMRMEAPKGARDSYYAFVAGLKEQREQLAKVMNDFERGLNNAISKRTNEINNQITASKNKIQELNQELNRANATRNEARASQVQGQLDKEWRHYKDLESQLKNVNNEFGTSKISLAAMNAEHHRLANLMREETQAQQQLKQGAKEYSEQVRKIAAEVRESAQWQKSDKFGFRRGMMSFDGRAYPVTENLDMGLRLEDQIVSILQRANDERQKGVQITQQQAQSSRQVSEEDRKAMEALGWVDSQQKRKYTPPMMNIERISEARGALQAITGTQEKWVDSIDKTKASYLTLSDYVKQLKNELLQLPKGTNDEAAKVLIREIQRAEREMQKFQQTMSRPVSLKDALSDPEKTLDDITYKIQRLQSYKRGLDLTDPKQAKELEQVDAKINELTKDLNKYMSTTRQASVVNNALSRSWNYMKNRLAFYFTVGASTQFIKNLIEVRSQYELNERALGILINSAEKGSQIFQELSRMSLVSPYTLIELSSAAKQLTAYGIAARDVVDTTRRLADMASAVGVPMERLTYALGQIKAYGYLNSRDQRMFANAGIPLAAELAKYYTEIEGKLVSTADVYDRIKKKAVDYSDVVQVINKMTDEGGKFYDFQAKMADTLKVRLANLTLAWNNMLNDMGKETQGFLQWTIGGLKTIFLHWKEIRSAVYSVAAAYGLVKAAQIVMVRSGLTEKYPQLLKATALQMGNLGTKTKGFGTALKEIGPTAGLMLLVTWIISASTAIYQAHRRVVEFNESLRDSAKNNFNDISKFVNQYRTLRDSLGKFEVNKNGIGSFSSVTNIKEDEAKKAWEAMREQIELSSAASDSFIGRLLTIKDVNERLRTGFSLLNDIQQANAAMKALEDTTISISQSYSGWWNAWMLPDGLDKNIKDYTDAVKGAAFSWEYFGQQIARTLIPAGNVFNAFENFHNNEEDAFDRLKKDIDKTSDSLLNFIKIQGLANNPTAVEEVYAQFEKKKATEGNYTPEQQLALQRALEEGKAEIMRQALAARIADENAALQKARDENARKDLQTRLDVLYAQMDMYKEELDKSRPYWNDFTTYLKERHMSEMQQMFGNMDAEQIKSLNFQEGKYAEWVRRMVENYATSHNKSYDEVFNHLKDWVADANMWQIFIGLTISTEDTKSFLEELKEADLTAKTAEEGVKRLKQSIADIDAELNKRKSTPPGKRTAEWIARGNKLLKDRQKAVKELGDREKEFNKATQEDYGHNQQQEKKDAAAAAKAKRKQEAEARKAAREAARAQREGETELQKAIKDSLQIIERERRSFDEMTKSGVSRIKAIERASSGFSDTVKNINAVLGKNGIPLFDPKVFAGSDDPHTVLSYLEDVLNNVKLSKFVKPEDIKMLDLKINEIKVDVAKYDSDKITKGLNNELNKLSEEYELSLAFDADPDLGNIFADMFQIDKDSLPNNFGELVERANAEIKKALEKKGVDTNKVLFDIMASNILDNEKDVAEGIYGLATRIGEKEESEFIKTLISFQNKFKENYKKIISDNNKMLEDLVKKYGNYTDKVAEIESDKIERIKKLNEEFYNDELRKRPEYAARIAAINNDAEKKLSDALFDEFKNSRLYIAMFENIEYAATSTLEAISNELDGLKSKLKNLSPEQLKTIYTQYEKIQKELLRRNPFKDLIKNAKAYAKAVGKSGKEAQKDFVQTKKKYEKQRDYVASLKVQLETLKATQPQNKIALSTLSDQVKIEDEKLKELFEEYELAQKLNDQYNMMRIIFGDQSDAISKFIQTVAQNLESLSEFRDTMNSLFGIDADKGETLFGHTLDAIIDNLSEVGKGLNKIVSSAQSMDVVGVATGAIGVVTGIGDAVASLFGDGKARTKRINREIVKSQEEVRKLEMAYNELERAIDRENGKEETRARREQIANKEAQLAEIERQKALEESKRKKDRDDEAIKSYEENAQDLRHEIEDLKKGVVDDLFGTEVKSAADEFVDAWVDAWKAGEKTLDAMKEKMNDMMMTLVKNAISSRIVQNLLQPVYDKVDEFTQDKSDGSYDLTQAELTALANLSANTGEKIDTALTSFYENLERLGITAKEIEESKELSALQAGISGITEEQASALEAYWNINTQEQFKHTTLLTQIRDLLSGSSGDVQIGVQAQMLLQLQQSYQVQMSIHSTLQGWTNPSGQAVRVELIS